MKITNVTNDYDNNCNCTENEYDIDITIPTLLLIIPYGVSFLCLMSLMIYTLIKFLFNKK